MIHDPAKPSVEILNGFLHHLAWLAVLFFQPCHAKGKSNKSHAYVNYTVAMLL